MSAPDTKAAKGWPPMLALGLCCAVLIAVPWAFKLLDGQALGEPCGGGFDCAALDGRCVAGEDGHFCTKRCTSDDECPSQSHCGVPPHDRWQLWFATSPMSERMCVPGPAPTEPLRLGEPPQQAPSQAGGSAVVEREPPP